MAAASSSENIPLTQIVALCATAKIAGSSVRVLHGCSGWFISAVLSGRHVLLNQGIDDCQTPRPLSVTFTEVVLDFLHSVRSF